MNGSKKLSLSEQARIVVEIDELEKEIDALEKAEYNFMDDKMKRLEHSTLYIHKKVETFVGRAITVDLIMDQSKLLSKDDAIKIFWKMEEVFNAADFFRLLKIANSSKLLPIGFYDIASKVNNLRLIFAHPRTHQKELRELRANSKRLEAYKDLKLADDLMRKHAINKQKERDELVERLANKRMSEIASRIRAEGLQNIKKIVREELEKELQRESS